jgi:hypothetical protein
MTTEPFPLEPAILRIGEELRWPKNISGRWGTSSSDSGGD